MGILDFIRNKKQKEHIDEDLQNETDLPKEVFSNDRVRAILEEEIKDFFPDEGRWTSNCFGKPSEVSYENLPCHLRDNNWLSKLFNRVLNRKGIFIPRYTIKKFMDTSENFANLRHEYELRIVKWQIDWINNGGERWLAPKEYDELSLLFSEDVDKIVRGGVAKTLRAIGMDSEVIEEGLEKYADIWRPVCMNKGFNNLYQPVVFMVGTPESADEEHKKNWLADREYRYYQEHKNSVDNYGTKTPAMQMTQEEHAQLVAILEQQNKQRAQFIENWRQNSGKNSKQHTMYDD